MPGTPRSFPLPHRNRNGPEWSNAAAARPPIPPVPRPDLMDPVPPSPDSHARHIAWNGFSLSTPAHWQPDDVETHFLSLTRHGRTMLECTWRPDPAEFSVPRRRAALERQNRRLSGFTTHPHRVPARWAQVLAALRPRFVYIPFAWHGGCGALAHDAVARYSIELRFPAGKTAPEHGAPRPAGPGSNLTGAATHAPGPAATGPDATGPDEDALREAALVLATLRLHARHETTPIRLHDMELDVPAGFVLRDFAFRPGLCALHFRRDADTLSVERLSPANVVLQGLPLRHWAARRAGVNTRDVQSRLPFCQPPHARETAAWQRTLRHPLLRAFPVLRGLSRAAAHEVGAAWLVGDENKLVAVCLRCSAEPAPDIMAALCASLRVSDAG